MFLSFCFPFQIEKKRQNIVFFIFVTSVFADYFVQRPTEFELSFVLLKACEKKSSSIVFIRNDDEMRWRGAELDFHSRLNWVK